MNKCSPSSVKGKSDLLYHLEGTARAFAVGPKICFWAAAEEPDQPCRSLHHLTPTAQPAQNLAAVIPARVCTTETHNACSPVSVPPSSAAGECWAQPDPPAILAPRSALVPLTPQLRLPHPCNLEVASKKIACCSVLLRVKEDRLFVFVN